MNKRKRKLQSQRHRNRRPAFSRELLARAADMVAQKKLIPLKDDIAFKLFLSAPTPESNACLRYFLSATTGREVTKARVTNSEVLPEYRKSKMPRLPCREANEFPQAETRGGLTDLRPVRSTRS